MAGRSEERIVPTTYAPTFVRISGPATGPPLILLHGAGSTSLMWVPNIQALSVAYRTFAVDQVNEFGRSLCTKPLRSFDDLIRWLDELIDSLQLSTVNLTGLSYGGALAAQYALRFPARVNKLVLLAPGNTVLRIGTGLLLRMLMTAFSRGRGIPSLMRYMFPDMARKDPAWVDAVVEQVQLGMRSLQRRKILFPRVLTDAEWRSLRVPSLFLVGEHEVIYSAEEAVRRLNRAAPAVTTEIIPSAGHDLTFAQSEVVNRRILEFLAQPAAAAMSAATASR